MKILSLYFKNINSLQGENRIDFNQMPLSDAGVFAITGPNGSGKSSVLDVMTLALYGETFKFDRPAEQVLTQHTAECFAQCEFVVNNVQYRSRWQVKREQDDDLTAPVLPATMLLTRVSDGEMLLASDAAKVRSMVAEIVGMDFRNFTRSTLLAQGDFAAFLNALDSERLDILERIVSMDMYADYQQDIVTRVEVEQDKVNGLQADLAAIPLLDAVTAEARSHDLADFKEQVHSFTEQLETLTQQMQGLHSLAELDEQYQHVVAEQTALQQQLNALQANVLQMDVAQGVEVLQSEVAAVAGQEAALAAEQDMLAGYQQQLAQLQTQLQALAGEGIATASVLTKSLSEQQEVIADLTFQAEHLQSESRADQALLQEVSTQLQEKQTDLADVRAWLQRNDSDVSLLEGFPDIGALKKLTAQIVDLKEQHKVTLKTSKSSLAQYKSDQSSLQALQKESPELQKQLVTYEAELSNVLNNHTLTELEEVYQEQQARVNDFKELIALTKVQSRFKDGLLVKWGLVGRGEQIDTQAVRQELSELQQRFVVEDNIKRALEQAVFNEGLLRKMQADRLHLVDQEPCPLCGALKHPYAVQPPKLLDSKQALQDQTARLQNLNTAMGRLQQQLQAAEKQQAAQQLKTDRLARIQAEWLTLCNRLNIASTALHIDDQKPIKRMLAEHTTELKDIARMIKSARQYQQKIATLQGKLEIQSHALVRLQGSVQEAEPVSLLLPQQQQALEQQLEHAIAEEKVLGEKVQAQLTALGEKMPKKGKEDALFDRLHQRRQTFQTYQLREKMLLEDIAQLEQKHQVVQTAVAEQLQRLQTCSATLRIEQSSGLQLAVIEKQKLINEKMALIAQLGQGVQAAQAAVQIQARAFGVNDYQALSSLLQLIPQRTAIQQQCEVLAAQLQEVEAVLHTLQQQQAKHQQLVGSQSLEACEQAYQQTLEQLDIAHLEVQRLEDVLATDALRQKKYQEIDHMLAVQQAQLEQARVELQQVQDETGHALRRKVQRKTADKLLSKTNQILEKISGRFYVRQADNMQGLALEIEDTFQQSTRRLPKTLSGGESFVVSLALALGLSELASKGQVIESLFLDEGFGSLDAETLYTVVSTLENLQTHGKKVGVISHVDGVCKRIKTQIAMSKLPNGFSQLKTVI